MSKKSCNGTGETFKVGVVFQWYKKSEKRDKKQTKTSGSMVCSQDIVEDGQTLDGGETRNETGIVSNVRGKGTSHRTLL